MFQSPQVRYAAWQLLQSPVKLCICTDPSKSNKALKRTHYQLKKALLELPKQKYSQYLMPKTDIGKCQWIKKGFTIFWTLAGRYRGLRMPFEIKPVAEEYQCCTNRTCREQWPHKTPSVHATETATLQLTCTLQERH